MGNLFLTIVGSLIILIPCLVLEVKHRAGKKSQLQNKNRKADNSIKDEVIYISKSEYDYL